MFYRLWIPIIFLTLVILMCVLVFRIEMESYLVKQYYSEDLKNFKELRLKQSEIKSNHYLGNKNASLLVMSDQSLGAKRLLGKHYHVNVHKTEITPIEAKSIESLIIDYLKHSKSLLKKSAPLD